MKKIYQTIDLKIFDTEEEALKHEIELKNKLIKYYNLELEIEQFNDICKDIIKNGKPGPEARDGYYIYTPYRLDNNIFYCEDDGSTECLFYNGIVYKNKLNDKSNKILIGLDDPYLLEKLYNSYKEINEN